MSEPLNAKAFNKAMGAVIRKERKARGLTMEAVAKQLGFTYQQQGKNEHGINACSAYLIARYAALFGISIAVFYELAETQPTEPSPAENDGFLAARYVSRIADAKLRSAVIDFTRKLAYSGEQAA